MIAVTCGLVLLGGGLHVVPLFHDFWLDEAWSYLLIRDEVAHPAKILTRLHTDNNHPLNSLTILLLGTSRNWPLYRMPAWIAGVLCIPLAGSVMRRFGTAHAAYAMLLVAMSYPLTVYSAEARGYSTMLCCALMSIDLIARWVATRNWRFCFAFWCVVILRVSVAPDIRPCLHLDTCLFRPGIEEDEQRAQEELACPRGLSRCAAVARRSAISRFLSSHQDRRRGTDSADHCAGRVDHHDAGGLARSSADTRLRPVLRARSVWRLSAPAGAVGGVVLAVFLRDCRGAAVTVSHRTRS